jgi:ankyrin repeat protein
LIHAIKGGHLTAARTLIDRGASLNRLTARGSTPLGFACELPDLAFARELLDLGADPNLVDPRLPNALPLVASMTKNPAATRLMLERGADPRVIVSSHGRGGALPPVFLAAARGDMRSVALLVAAGADPTTVLWRDGKGANRLRGQTALHSAAVSDDLATLEYFLSLGLDPAQTEAYGDNPLDMALLSDARRTAAHLRKLGLKTRAERGLPPRDS